MSKYVVFWEDTDENDIRWRYVEEEEVAEMVNYLNALPGVIDVELYKKVKI